MQVVEQYNVLRGRQLAPAALVVGGLSEGPQLTAIRKGARIVVATPGRLEDFLDRRLVQFGALQTLVLDEADRMLDMGFLPAIRRIVSILPKDRQTMCFSATMEGSVAHLVKDYLKNPVRLAFGSTLKPSENVRLQAFEVAAEGKQDMLHHLLARESGRCLVFSRTKRGTERIARALTRHGINAAMIHGDRSQSQRIAALAGFQKGQYKVLVATDVASRGIHVQDIAHVINYDLPELAENFIHRVGRTGRAGETRRCFDSLLEGPAHGAVSAGADARHQNREDAGRFEGCRKDREREPRPGRFRAEDGAQEPIGPPAGRIPAGADGKLASGEDFRKQFPQVMIWSWGLGG